MSLSQSYRVDGRDQYTITYQEQSNGTYALYCSEHPPIPRSYSSNVVDSHLYSNGRICIASGKEPRTLDRAKAIAFAFCEGFSQYVRTGAFPNGPKRVNV